MSEIVNSRYQGILVPDERFSLDNLTASDHAAAPSSYSQAGPKPGIPASQQSTRMVLQASGEQPASKQLEIHSVRAGHPGLDRAGYLWSDQTQDTPEEFGWDVPQLLTGWQSIFWSTDATELSATPSIIRLQSGRLLALGLQDKTTFAQTVKLYDPDAATKWSTVGTLTPDNPTAQSGPALCQLPSGRVLLYLAQGAQVDCYFSDDDGANWDPYSYRVLDVAVENASISMIRASYSAGEVLLLVQYTDSGTDTTCDQYASDDLGARFVQVFKNWSSSFPSGQVNRVDIAENDGGFVVAYHATLGGLGDNKTRSIASAFESIDDATDVSVDFGSPPNRKGGLAIWRDDSGILYCAYTKFSVVSYDVNIAMSRDSAATWEEMPGDAAWRQASTTSVMSFAAQSIAGQVVVLARWESGGSLEGPQSLAAVYFGGYSTHTGPSLVDAVDFGDDEYISFSTNSALSIEGGSWLPVARPTNSAWTAAGTGGADALLSGALEITTAADTHYSYRDGGENDQKRIFAEFALDVDDGDGALTSTQIGAVLRLGNGATVWSVSINVSSAGWTVYDIGTGLQIGSAVTVDMTKLMHIRVALDQGSVRTWYARRSNVTYRDWDEGSFGLVSAQVSTSLSRITWGHFKPGTNVSRWSMVGYCYWPGFWTPVSDQYAGGWNTPEDLHPKSYSTTPSQIVDKTRIAAVAGPSRYGEKWLVKTNYDYPARDLFPANSPSPRAAWRSTDTTEQILAWDISELAASRIENSSLACVLIGINFKTAYLEKKTGAVWSAVCTVNAAEGFESLRFQREGQIVFPETGGSAHKAGRYVMYDEMPGGTFYDVTNTKYRTITANTEGAWTEEAAKHPFVTIADADDTEATSGDCEIWAPSAAGLAHSYTSDSRFYRLRIPAQTTASGYFEIGQMVIGPLAVFGTQYGRGRQIVSRNNTEQVRLPNGEIRARKRGPQSREVEFAWTDGVDASQINRPDPVPDYVASAVGQEPMASLKDTLYLMDGVIRRQDGAGKPVVYFARIAADSVDDQTNNPLEFVYGRITSNGTRSNILGDEVRTNLDRLNTITIQELV